MLACMRVFLILLWCIALHGCSSGVSSESLQGVWSNGPGSYTHRFTFEGNSWKTEISQNIYVSGVPQGSDAGTSSVLLGLQIDSGTYSLSGNTCDFTTLRSSCVGVATVSRSFTRVFSFQQRGQATVLIWQDDPDAYPAETGPPTGMEGATVGCFDASLKFTPNAEALVP